MFKMFQNFQNVAIVQIFQNVAGVVNFQCCKCCSAFRVLQGIQMLQYCGCLKMLLDWCRILFWKKFSNVAEIKNVSKCCRAYRMLKYFQ